MPIDSHALPSPVAQLFRQDELPPGLAWIDDLSPVHQRIFYAELALAAARVIFANSGGDVDQEITALLDSWRATAAIDADPALAKQLLTPREKKQYVEWSA